MAQAGGVVSRTVMRQEEETVADRALTGGSAHLGQNEAAEQVQGNESGNYVPWWERTDESFGRTGTSTATDPTDPGSPWAGGAGSGGSGGGPGGPYGGWGTGGSGGSHRSGPRPGRSRRGAAAVAAALVLGAAGGAAAMGVLGGGSAGPARTSGSSPAPANPVVSSSGTSHLNVTGVLSRVEPGVVDINTTLGVAGASYGKAAGTGMVLTSSGEVITNNHVVAGSGSISVTIPSTSKTYPAKVVAVDPTADVALLQLKGASRLRTAPIGSSTSVAIGQPVVAIGNALGLGGTPTVTTGIVSGMGRSITASDPGGPPEHLKGLIQTDAPINPGNSGGPLVSAAGKVIGMDTAAATGSSTQPASNVGFAIPISRVMTIVHQMQSGQHAAGIFYGSSAFLGVATQTLNPFVAAQLGINVSNGAAVVQVVPGTPAASLGLSSGDVITDLGGRAISSTSALRQAILAYKPGSRVHVTWIGPNGTQSGWARLASGPAQ